MNETPPMSSIPLHRPSDPGFRDALRLLGMVHELHKQGWQRLRVRPYMAPSGCYWRCELYAPDYDPETWDGDEEDPRETLCARYSSSTKNLYYGWADAAQDDARHLASKFLERFPRLCERSRGRDWAYAGWFTEVLGHTEHGRIPMAWWDLMDEEDEGVLWMGGPGGIPMPLGPPPIGPGPKPTIDPR